MDMRYDTLTPPPKTRVNKRGRVLLEHDVEEYLIKRCKERFWMCEKFSSPEKRSVPDRIITAEKFIFFIELKAPGKTATDTQYLDHEERRKRGILVMVCDCYEQVDIALDLITPAWLANGWVKLPPFLIT